MSEDCSQDRGTSEIGTREGTYIRLKANVTVAFEFSELTMQLSASWCLALPFPDHSHAKYFN